MAALVVAGMGRGKGGKMNLSHPHNRKANSHLRNGVNSTPGSWSVHPLM